ncbi:MAG: thioredoxin fold domain-containing protein [Arenimonas sp.]|uniref:thioredoxin fold domain-containing protein n=1 Tax=Arenimonas sp. TaxID=1872635 RepID=UPI0025C0A08A|nr:thioredoxin fold domain-containing protein [Arenimonas sp.]MBW8367356.1 thioredoxin fold domain-containing protein [Arenimonas sp.]
MIRHTLTAFALVASLTACAAEPQATPAAPAAGAAKPVAAAPGAPASEAALRAAMKELAPDAVITRIDESPIPGFKEVAMGARVVYLSEDGKRLIQGALFDIPSRENLTQASESVLRKDLLDAAGADRRIVFAAANPRHVVTVFTDIDCGYCRKLHEQMAEYNQLGISVEYLFFPRSGLSGESFDKAVSVWCAPDRRQAMTAAKAGQSLPKGNCTNPVTMDYTLGRSIGLDGTPAIYAANGEQLGGYVTPAEMLARLDQIAAKPAR